ncbi:MAG: NADH-quinone oxidoreductase subunit L [Anaerolineae bacterium]
MSDYAWLIPLFPLLAFALIVFFTRRNHRTSAYTAIGGMVLAMLVAYGVFAEALSRGSALGQNFIHNTPLNWFSFGSDVFKMGWMIDPLAAVMLFMVTTICLMIFIYSVGYMREKVGEEHGHAIIEDDPRYSRFFAYISLFASAMLALVISANLLLFFIAWEIMGFCSYALIGFWSVRGQGEHHIDEAQVLRARAASLKAFLTTRVGDTLFMAGMIFLFILTGSLDFQTIFAPDKLEALTKAALIPGTNISAITVIALLILSGTIGKSAQFPLHIWLPDAMEGPTPVSALIHAATMVAAGVYLIARTYPLFAAAAEAGGPAMAAVALVGAFTALFAATLGLAQDDIKRVLAYSTISQLGYMIAALGIGAFAAGSFHLITHAFFKALLFLAAGSVIHGIGTNDMMQMGGLRNKMPKTSLTFIIGALALMGIFPFAGFWSKDEILGDALRGGLGGDAFKLIIWIMLVIAAFLTALYTSRQIFLSFFGKPRDQHLYDHAHESPPVMWVPLAILAFFATVIGFWNIPGIDTFFNFVGAGGVYGVTGKMAQEITARPEVDALTIISAVASLGIALAGFGLGWLLYGRKPLLAGEEDPMALLGFIWDALRNKYWLDELYGFRINPDGSGVTGLLLRLVIWIAQLLYAFDRTVVDGLVNLAGWLGRGISGFGGVFDHYIVDGIVNGVGYVVEAASGGLRLIQTGRVQNYLLLALLGAAIFALIFLVRPI